MGESRIVSEAFYEGESNLACGDERISDDGCSLDKTTGNVPLADLMGGC